MMRWAVTAAVVTAFLLGPFLAAPASAADVNQTLIAQNISWHVGSASSSNTQIAVNVGDTIHLTLENRESTATTHTFTAPHFPAAPGQLGSGTTLNVTLPQGATFVWNYTFTSADAGTWQFYCSTPGHTTGTYPTLTGMVGKIVVTAAPPPTPGFEAVLAIAALGIVAAAMRAVPHRKK